MISAVLCLLPAIIVLMTSVEGSTTSTFNTPGTYNLYIPSMSTATVTLWGAGGAGTGIGNWANPSALFPGGSGAFISCAIDALYGMNIYLVVGQGGRVAGYCSSTTTAVGGGGMSIVPVDLITLVEYFLTVLISTFNTGRGTTRDCNWSPAGGGGRSAVQFSSGVDAIVAGGGGGGGAAKKSVLGSNGPLSKNHVQRLL